MTSAIVILTRFNVPTPGPEALIRAQEGWLRERMALFERYTAPSVRAQSMSPLWMIYLDPLSPPWLFDRLAAIVPTAHLIRRDAVPREALLADLSRVVPREATRLITVNLDNDDAIADDFVARIVAADPGSSHPSAVYFTNGLVRTNRRLYQHADPHNAFCAVAEPWSDRAATCWADWHNRLHHHMATHAVGGPTAWLQVVHGRNVSNRARGIRVSPAMQSAQWGALLADLPEPTRREVLADRWVAYPVRRARDFIRAGLRNLLVATVGPTGLDRVKQIVAGRIPDPGQIDRGLAEDVTHLVLTRFNVRMQIYGHRDEDWLRDRMDLFRTYCLPTLATQATTSFRWLIFIDAQSPSWLREELAEILPENATVVPVDGLFTGEWAAQQAASRTTTRWLVTTRVDNDDALARDFITTIQGEVSERRELINLVDGAQYCNGRVYRRPYTQNPFITLVEDLDAGPAVGVFARRHFEIGQVAPVRNVRTSHPMWLQIVHADNVLTAVVGLRTPGPAVLQHFVIAPPLDSSRWSYYADRAAGSMRIGLRLIRRPHRLVELGRTLVARRAHSGTTR